MDLAARRGSPNERITAMHDAGCIDAAKATFRTDATMSTTVALTDARAEYVPALVKKARAAIIARGYEPIDGAPPAMICAFTFGDTYAAPDWPSLVFYAQHYVLCPCPNHGR